MGGLRAVTAVIALYAFVLQAFLGGLMPVPAFGTGSPICAASSDAPVGDDAPAQPAHGPHTLCCTAVAAFAAADHPGLTSSAIVWPARIVVRVAWRDEAWISARGPPGSIPHPRGPPAA